MFNDNYYFSPEESFFALRSYDQGMGTQGTLSIKALPNGMTVSEQLLLVRNTVPTLPMWPGNLIVLLSHAFASDGGFVELPETGGYPQLLAEAAESLAGLRMDGQGKCVPIESAERIRFRERLQRPTFADPDLGLVERLLGEHSSWRSPFLFTQRLVTR